MQNVFLLSTWKKLTLELCIVKDFIMYPSTIPWSASHILNLERFSEVTIKYSYFMVTFSVFVVCDVIVFMELPTSYIFKGTLEASYPESVCHSKRICAKIWPAQFKTQNSNLKEKWREFNGLNFCCCNSRFSLNIIIFWMKRHTDLLPCLMITLLKAKVVMWYTKWELFLNV